MALGLYYNNGGGGDGALEMNRCSNQLPFPAFGENAALRTTLAETCSVCAIDVFETLLFVHS